MFELDKIRHIHFELTNKCNAACPCCARQHFGKQNPWLVPRELYLDDIKRIMHDSRLLEQSNILYCGNYGDPCISRDIIEIVKWFKEQKFIPGVTRQQVINTNGGMKTPKFWAELGEQLHKKDECGRVTFSIDGLEDTNHFYRRQVKWDKLWANLNAFLDAGGSAWWEFLVFGHNKHQVEEAREIATSLGMTFVAKRPFGFDSSGGQLGSKPTIPVYDIHGRYEFSLTSEESETPGPIVEEQLKGKAFRQYKLGEISHEWKPLPAEKTFMEKSCIKCKALGDSEWFRSDNFYVTSSGHVLPCCFMHGPLETNPYNYASYQLKNAVNMDDFDLSNKSLDEIVISDEMNKTFFENMHKQSIDEGSLLFCGDHCGESAPMDLLYKKEV